MKKLKFPTEIDHNWHFTPVKTDKLFYRLFQAQPTLAFELAGLDVPEPERYDFISLEVKETAFRVDGIVEPPSDRPEAPRGYVEVQFQPDENFFSYILLAKYCFTLVNILVSILGRRSSFIQGNQSNASRLRQRCFSICPICAVFFFA
jgi:hypothetical protein